MTTATTVTNIDQSSDAAFRVWVQEMITALVSTIGLTQTADTGQINTSTVTRAAVANTAAGYVILRFNDSLQGTSPIFMKVEFGAGSGVAVPNSWFTVGTGSNGSGTITGTTSVRSSAQGGTPISALATYISRWCYTATQGSLGFCYKINGVTNGGFMSLILCRSTDPSTGASTGDSYEIITNSGNGGSSSSGNCQCYSFLTSALPSIPSPGVFASIPFGLSSTLVNGGVQVGMGWILTPKVQVIASWCVVLFNDFPNGSTLVIALVGSTTHTFICIGQPWGNTQFSNSVVNGFCMMLWE